MTILQKVASIIITGCLLACKNDISLDKLSITSIDSAYNICRDVYFWNENLPDYNPKVLRQFTNNHDIIENIKSFSSLHNGKPLDRWSFSIDKATWRNIENNQATGFGMNLVFITNDDLRVKTVYSQSDAYQRGLRRTARIISIDNYTATIENKYLILNSLKKPQIVVEFENQSKIRDVVKLTASFFQKEAIANVKILENKIGYFYFDVFEGGKETSNQLEQIFIFFKQQNIKDLVIDLRYNHGGDGIMAQQIANAIIPKAAENKIFTRVINNKKYSLLNYSLYFKASANNLNLSRIFFITSPETASSSEALINALQAVMEIIIVGTKTHGKPFGFLPYAVSSDYIFPVAFKNVNNKGYGDYYDGIPVDFEVEDDLTHDFGDTEESCLKSILSYIKNGQFPASQLKNKRLNIERQSINEQEIPSLFYLSKPGY